MRAQAHMCVGRVQEALASRTPEEQAITFASVDLIQPLFALRFPTLKKETTVAFEKPAAALLAAQLELMCSFIPPSEQVRRILLSFLTNAQVVIIVSLVPALSLFCLTRAFVCAAELCHRGSRCFPTRLPGLFRLALCRPVRLQDLCQQ